MTDERDDKLNAAIDAVLSGNANTVGDEESLAMGHLAANLRGMPSSEFKSRLAADLFPQRRGVSRTALPRQPFLRRLNVPSIRNIGSRRIAAPLTAGAGVLIAAVALAVVLIGPFGGSSSPAEAYGRLPAPVSSTAPVGNGSGTITWHLDTNTILPDSAPAYLLTMPAVTQERAESIGHTLGITGASEVLNAGTDAIAYHMGAAVDRKFLDPADCQPSFDIWTSGWFSYRGCSGATGSPPDDAKAIIAAHDWLANSGLTNGESFELTVQPAPIFPDKPDAVAGERNVYPYAQLIAQPAGHSGPENGPLVQIDVDSNGTIAGAGGFWAKIDGESDYHLHGADAFLASLESQAGTFAALKVSAGDVAGADVNQNADAQVASVQLTYLQATPTNPGSADKVYLVPVYTAKVLLTQDGKDVAGFAMSIPATGPTSD